MDSLALYIDHQILLVTQDGRTVIGSLRGYDTKVNLILRDAEERIYSSDRGVETRELGLYVVKGDHVALIGLLDVDLDKDLDLDRVRALPIAPCRH